MIKDLTLRSAMPRAFGRVGAVSLHDDQACSRNGRGGEGRPGELRDEDMSSRECGAALPRRGGVRIELV